MSILESMRSGTDSTAMQVVLALVVVSFVFWYSSPQGDITQVVATVNGTKIMDTTLNRRLRLESARYDRALSDEEVGALRERVRQDLIEDEVLSQEARRLGIEVSDTEVARELLQVDIFRNDEGLFDERLYESWLRRNAYASRSDFEEELRAQILRGKLQQMVYLGVTVPDPLLEATFVEQNTRVDVRYVRVRPGAFEDDVAVDAAQVDAFLASSMQRVKDTYDADFDRKYNLPQEVELTMIRFALKDDGMGAAQLRPRLDGLVEQIQGGADMATLAAKWSEDPSAGLGGGLGRLKVPSLSIKVADALSIVEPGQITEVVVEDKHMSVYRLESREAARVIPLEEVQRDIAEALIRRDEGPGLAAAFAEALHSEWLAAGAIPEEKIAEQGLLASNTGLIPLQGTGGLYSPPAALLDDAAQAQVGAVLPEVYMQGDAYWVAALIDREDADMDVFTDERDLVRAMVLQQRRVEFWDGWVDHLVSDARVN